MSDRPSQLISYIAPAAPATRRPAEGDEPFLRPEIGFTPAWYRQHMNIDFGRPYHTDPLYRAEAMDGMRAELKQRFPGMGIAGSNGSNTARDMLTGTYGIHTIAAIYGARILYAKDNWPDHQFTCLTDDEVDRLEPPDLAENSFFHELMSQLDRIATHIGRIDGYINWQSVLNNAFRLRGEQLFVDMLLRPDRCRRLFARVSATMIDAIRRVYDRQRAAGVEIGFVTIGNCLVNMISPRQYQELVLPLDRQIADAFGCIGIHNCAWNADPYLDAYAQIPNVAYIDMGIDSDLARARDLFPHARRALMYTPMDAANKPIGTIREDFERVAGDYGPCDIVLSAMEAGTPDDRVIRLAEMCHEISERNAL